MGISGVLRPLIRVMLYEPIHPETNADYAMMMLLATLNGATVKLCITLARQGYVDN